MFILVNGAFGIGKTAVANALKRLLVGAAIVDPEHIGLVLQRVPGSSKSDFQHLAAWRRLTVLWGRTVGYFRPTVIIPMAFSELAYLREVRSGLGATGRPVLHFCLTAPLNVVRERLAARGEPLSDARWSWVHRRAEECCQAHERPEFAVHVPTTGLSPEAIATALIPLVRQGAAT